MNPRMVSVADRRKWDLNWLAQELGFSQIGDMSRMIGAIDQHGYTLFVKSKEKRRVISAPQKWLKDLQRRINHGILSQLPISDCAFNTLGRGQIPNALRHVGQSYMTAVDVKDCFPSTSVAMVAQSFRDLSICESVTGTLTRLTTFHGFLPQGAPTSDSVLNLVFAPIDAKVMELAERYDARYSRFTDDLTFSAERPLHGLERTVAQILKPFGYRANPAKLQVWGPADRHIVTGVAVRPKPKPTPRFLWSLARDLDRYESGAGMLTENQIRSKINWVNDIDVTVAGGLLARLEKVARRSK